MSSPQDKPGSHALPFAGENGAACSEFDAGPQRDCPHPHLPLTTKGPIGILLLSILHGVGGVGMALLLISMLRHPERLAKVDGIARSVGESSLTVSISVAALTGLGLGSAIGMFLGRSWGWWLGAFYYVNSLFRYSRVIFLASTMTVEEDGSAYDPSRIYVRYGPRLVINSLLLLYFFKDNVFEFFGFEHHRRRRMLGELLAWNVGLVGLLWLL